MVEDKNLQEKYLMLQLIDAQIKEIEQELQAIKNKNAELIKLKDSLESLKDVKESSKGYSPLGLGIFVESKITNIKEVLVNVGSNIIVKKDIKSAKELLENQLSQTEEIILKLEQNIQTLSAKAQEIEKELQAKG